MGNYILKRLVSLCITVAGIAIVTFFLSLIVPLDPLAAIAGPQADPETVERLRALYGFDQPLHVQFYRYIERLAHFDLGMSFQTGRPVLDDILYFFPATFELASIAMIIAIVFGIPLGVISAVKRNSFLDQAARVISLIGVSMPVFWLGLVLLLIFYFKLDWLPEPGRLDIMLIEPPRITGMLLIDSAIAGDGEVFWDAFMHSIMPATVLGLFGLAGIARIARSSMLDVLSQEYVKTARIKGLSEFWVIARHAFPNALVPTVTMIGLTYGGLLEGAVLTETIFSWPGLGRYLTVAFLTLDLNAIVGGTMLVAISYSLVNLLVDLLYAYLNPKITLAQGDE
ncbi:MAG: ABC transporter permease [Alphaproteobacteria bacterium]|jgi:peptide/nickel transport system permease protein|nr:ABC transporter permease [Alphaproteobacteria bacterium]MBT4017582.1 ABC transporter permease [Alphaproteobacteria bacterium]MBT4966094.1 ABC transporter permease [Alphaproteobacteria bacterium]MBT5159447.1 ABC transporter permease [Alphaproteobacteria bacterium]MBT6387263.1 ABC transporter permease [Alphaproteobacteria bacterium]